jgi:hypothetical protein
LAWAIDWRELQVWRDFGSDWTVVDRRKGEYFAATSQFDMLARALR